MNGSITMNASVSPRQFIVAVGVVLAVIGAIALVLPVSADALTLYGYETVDCGPSSAPSGPVSGPGVAACSDALSDRRIWAIPLFALGLIAAIGGATVRKPTTT